MIISTAQLVPSYLRSPVLSSCSFALLPNLDLAAGDRFLRSGDAAIFAVRGGGAAVRRASYWPMTFFAVKRKGGAGGKGVSKENIPENEKRFRGLVRRAEDLLEELQKTDAKTAAALGRRIENEQMEWGEAESDEYRQELLSSMERSVLDIELKIPKSQETIAEAMLQKIRSTPRLSGYNPIRDDVKTLRSKMEMMWHQENMGELIKLEKWMRSIVTQVSRQIARMCPLNKRGGPEEREEMTKGVSIAIYRELRMLNNSGVKDPGSLAHGLTRVSYKDIIKLLEGHERYIVARALVTADPFTMVNDLEGRHNVGYVAARKRLLQLQAEEGLDITGIEGVARTIRTRCVYHRAGNALRSDIDMANIAQMAVRLADKYKEIYDTFLRYMKKRGMMWAKGVVQTMALLGIEEVNVEKYVKDRLRILKKARAAAEDELRMSGITDKGLLLNVPCFVARNRRIYTRPDYEDAAREEIRVAVRNGSLKGGPGGRTHIKIPRPVK